MIILGDYLSITIEQFLRDVCGDTLTKTNSLHKKNRGELHPQNISYTGKSILSISGLKKQAESKRIQHVVKNPLGDLAETEKGPFFTIYPIQFTYGNISCNVLISCPKE